MTLHQRLAAQAVVDCDDKHTRAFLLTLLLADMERTLSQPTTPGASDPARTLHLVEEKP